MSKQTCVIFLTCPPPLAAGAAEAEADAATMVEEEVDDDRRRRRRSRGKCDDDDGAKLLLSDSVLLQGESELALRVKQQQLRKTLLASILDKRSFGSGSAEVQIVEDFF